MLLHILLLELKNMESSKKMYVTGWGTINKSKPADILQQLEVSILIMVIT